MNKQELRKIYREKRQQLSASDKEKLEDMMLIQFQQLPLGFPQRLMSYLPMEKFNEYDPWLLEEHCLFITNHEVKISVPLVQDGMLKAIEVNEQTGFVTGGFGVTEPVNGDETDPAAIDLVIVPLLCFDVQGFRVGYGKGYYDGFLKKAVNALKVGVSFFEPVEKITDVHSGDVPLDHVITPVKTFHF